MYRRDGTANAMAKDAGLILLVVLLISPVDALSRPPRKFSEIGATSGATKGLVSSLTALVNAIGRKDASMVPPRIRAVATLDVKAVLEGLRGDFVEREYLWSGQITPELYAEECVFTDPTLSFSGLDTFEANLENLDPWINRFVPATQRKVVLRSLELVQGKDVDVIEAEWRMVGDLALPWRPRLLCAGD